MKCSLISFLIFFLSCSSMNNHRNGSFRSLSQESSSEDLSRFESEIYKGFYDLVHSQGGDFEEAMKLIQLEGYNFRVDSLPKKLRVSLMASGITVIGAYATYFGLGVLLDAHAYSLNTNASGLGSSGSALFIMGAALSTTGLAALASEEVGDQLDVATLKNQDKVKEIDEMKRKIVDKATIVFSLNNDDKKDLYDLVNDEYNETLYRNLESNTQDPPKTIVQIMKDNKIAIKNVLIYEKLSNQYLNNAKRLSKKEVSNLSEAYGSQDRIFLIQKTMQELAQSHKKSGDQASYEALKQALAEINIIKSTN